MNDVMQQALYYLNALWRRKWLALGTALVVAALGWVGVASMPDQYESRARIYIDTANVLGPLLKGVAVENDVDKQVEVMRQTILSRPNIEQISRMTDLDVSVSKPSEYEALIGRLGERISVAAEQKNLFSIAFTDRSPLLARNVVQALTTIFVENNLGENRADIDNAQSFLQRQIREYEQKLDTAERELARFKQSNGEFLPGQSGLQDALADARSALGQSRAALQDSSARKALLERELAVTAQVIGAAGAGSGPPSNVVVRMMETRMAIDDLLSRYTEQHPDVQTMKRRLKALEQEFASEQQFASAGPGEMATGAGGVPNPVYSDLRIELVRERSNFEALQEQVRRQENRVAELEKRIFLVPEVEAQLKKLTRDYDVIRGNYETLLSRQESARISSEREQEGSRVNYRIIENAQIPLLPSGPPRILLLFVVFIMSIGSGVALSWLVAMSRVTYGSVDHLRHDFVDIPVIGALSDVKLVRDKKRNKRETRSFTALCLFPVVVFALLLGLEAQFGLQRVFWLVSILCLPVLLGGVAILAFMSFGTKSRSKFHFLVGNRLGGALVEAS